MNDGKQGAITAESSVREVNSFRGLKSPAASSFPNRLFLPFQTVCFFVPKSSASGGGGPVDAPNTGAIEIRIPRSSNLIDTFFFYRPTVGIGEFLL